MNLAPLYSLSVLLADIVIGPPPVPLPPPPSEMFPSHWAGNALVSLSFWTLAAAGGAALWWLRRRRVAPSPPALEVPPK